MNHLIKSTTDKLTVAFIYLLLVEISVSLVLAISFMADFHFYARDSATYPLEKALSIKSAEEFDKIEDYVELTYKKTTVKLSDDESAKLDNLRNTYSSEASNIFFIAKNNENGKTILSNRAPNDIEKFVQSDFCYSQSQPFSFYSENTGKLITGTIHFNVLKEMNAKDGYRLILTLVTMAKSVRYLIFVLLFILICASIFLLGLLMASMGNDNNSDEKKHTLFIDKIPFDLLTLLIVAIIAFIVVMIVLTAAADVKETNIVLWNSIVLVLSFVISLILLIYCISVATRIKKGHVYKNTLVYRSIARIRKKRGINDDGYFKVPFLGKALITIGIALLADIGLIIYFIYKYTSLDGAQLSEFKFLYFALAQFIAAFLLGAVFIMIAVNLYYVRESGKSIAGGDFDNVADSHLMFGDFKTINDDLISIKDDIINALEDKNKNQELRNELITNISHDIKTPLTSIINYATIISSGKCEPEDMESYSEIIRNQSSKLNDLLHSLIEVSQLSAGNVEVNLEPINVELFISQTVEEFSIKFNEKSLALEFSVSDEEILINADGMKLWRVFENLFSNIHKYAMPGTRVYVDVLQEDGKTLIVLKNISNTPISSNAEELLMRFKREDTSRHTEGNGLGLSIAKSFTEIQGGKFDISVDGDLFKTVLTFEKYRRENEN